MTEKLLLLLNNQRLYQKSMSYYLYTCSYLWSSCMRTFFLDIRELEGQYAESIIKCILTTRSEFGSEDDYLSKNLIAFTSDGASVMLNGVPSGVGVRLKIKIPCLVALSKSQPRSGYPGCSIVNKWLLTNTSNFR